MSERNGTSNGKNGVSTSNGASNGTNNGISNGTSHGIKLKAPPTPQTSSLPGAPKKPTRVEVDDSLAQLTNLFRAANRPLPNKYGDGKERKLLTDVKMTGTWNDIVSLYKQGHLRESIKTLRTLAKHKKHGGYTDDKTMIMEYVIRLSTHLPQTSLLRMKLTASQVNQLWNSLQHPPFSYVGSSTVFRKPDGSGNNPYLPDLGKAGTPYARTVKPMTLMPMSKPDAGLVFDSLMCRREYRPHRNNVSSMLYYIATIIIHDLFRTNRKDPCINDTSSYLDLAPLYGNNEADQKLVRTFKDGKLKPDVFCDKRILGFPPGVCVILIMFNRFHNYVVEQLAAINEGGRFEAKVDPREGPNAKQIADDRREELLFQTGRLVTCGLYINIILSDYLRTIVNLNRTNSTWTLDPRFAPAKIYSHDDTPMGVGNQCSAEFNLVYRWHSAISARDEKWAEELYTEIFGPNVDHSKMAMHEFITGVMHWERRIPDDPSQRIFGKLQRLHDGKFSDDGLVNILRESIEDPAGASGANNIPAVLRAVEIMGIECSRKWQVASLNEFRAFFGLEPHKTFEDINPDPVVADALRQLYDHPDYVELYAGLTAESDKTPMAPGVGICPSYTISRAILSDAVVLVRSDRHYTIDYTPAALTNWGYQEVASDLNINHGCVFYKLFLRCFPNHFTYNSIYAMYPLTIPSENRKIFTDLGRVDEFDFDPPKFVKPRTPILNYAAIQQILEDKHNFNMRWDGFLYLYDKPFMMSGDSEVFNDMRKFTGQCIYAEMDWRRQVREFYESCLDRLFKEKSYRAFEGGKQCYQVDVVRDIGNLAMANFAATLWGLPLKTKDNPKDFFTEQEIYDILTLMFIVIFFDVDPAKSFPLRKIGKKLVQQFGKLVELEVKAAKKWEGFMGGYFAKRNTSPLRDYGGKMIKRLLDGGLSPEDATWSYILPAAGASCSNQGQVFAQVVDFYLRPENAHHLKEIQRLSRLNTPEADELIKKYAFEGNRLAGTFGLYRTVACDHITVQDGDRTVNLSKGERVFVNFITASTDANVFPDPHVVSLDRPEESYMQYGKGDHQCLGMDLNKTSLPACLKFIGRLKNLRRAPGVQGTLKCVDKEGGFKIYLREDYSGFSPFPVSMKIRFDGIEGDDELPTLG